MAAEPGTEGLDVTNPVDPTARNFAGAGCVLAIVGGLGAWVPFVVIVGLLGLLAQGFGFDEFFGPILVFGLVLVVAIPAVGLWNLLAGSTMGGRPYLGAGRPAAAALLVVGLSIPVGWLLLASDGFSHPDSLAGWLTWGTTAAGALLAGAAALILAGRTRDSRA